MNWLRLEVKVARLTHCHQFNEEVLFLSMSLNVIHTSISGKDTNEKLTFHIFIVSECFIKL